MPVRFQKMHGAGNDFVLLDLRDQDYELDAEKASQLADRHTGVGCDQLLVLGPASESGCLVRFEVWNADGSRAGQCGNGIRCIGLYLQSRGETPAGEFLIQGPVSTFLVEGLENQQFRVNMGRPAFAAEKVPLTLAESSGWYELATAGHTLRLGAVSIGNPHALLEVDDIQAAPVDTLGLMISRDPAFPRGCNAGFAEIIDRNSIALRVFERGAAETLACGSGACAAVAILIRNGKLDAKVLVQQEGGTLMIEWNGFDKPILMTGPAVHLFEGILQ